MEQSVKKLQPDFYALFPHIPTEVLDLIILRECTRLMGYIARRGNKIHSLNVIIDGCGSFKALDKRLQKRRAKGDKKSTNKGAKKYYKKIRLLKVSQFV